MKDGSPAGRSERQGAIGFQRVVGREDLGQLQTDASYHRMLGVDRVTDPTTMGDFLRRFGRRDLNDMKGCVWAMRGQVWQTLGSRLGRHASLDLDSRVCPVYGDQKKGAGYSYKRTFAYHPEMLSLAETGEWLDVVNQPGNKVSGGRAAYLLRRNLPQVKEHFASVCIRGDSKFGRTDVLTVAAEHDVRECVCWASSPTVVKAADDLPQTAWRSPQRHHRTGENLGLDLYRLPPAKGGWRRTRSWPTSHRPRTR